MPKASCSICRKTWHNENIKLYHVPQDALRRDKWNQVCGTQFNNSSRVCSIHFLESDFHGVKKKFGIDGTPKRRRLKQEALPSRYLKGPPTDALQESAPVLDAERSEDSSVDFIDERLFDEPGCTLVDAPFFELNESLPIEPTAKKDASTAYISRGVQTGSSTTRICGVIVVTKDNMIYSLNCFHCDKEFPIWCWSKFLWHVRECQHVRGQTHIDTDELHFEEAIVAEKKTVTIEELEIERCENFLCNDTIEMETPMNEEMTAVAEDVFESEREETNQTNSTQEDFFEEQTIELSAEPDFNEAISFGHTDSAIVMDFLDIFKAHPVLWEIRENSLTQYDAAVEDVTKELNKKWHLNITPTAVANSLNSVKEWYRRMLNDKSLQLNTTLESTVDPFGQQYNKYFKKCAEFLSSLDISKPPIACNLCQLVFHNETHLQVHKFKHHQVGALPYKCRLCVAQFDCREALKAHKKSHPKTHTFACQECGKDFPHKYMLRKHAIVHEAARCTCDVCGKKFSHSKFVRPHKKFVHGPLQYKCQQCPKIFRNSTRLKYHMKYHRGERDYVCDQCGKKFMRQKNFVEHKRLVHDCMAYECLICQRQFLSYSGLSNHRKQAHLVLEGTIEQLEALIKEPFAKHTYVMDPETNVRRLACNMCNKAYRYHGGLTAHKIKEHGFVQPSKRRLRKGES